MPRESLTKKSRALPLLALSALFLSSNLLIPAEVGAAPQNSDANCFDSSRKPSVSVLQNAPPPRDGARVSSAYFPASAFTTMNVDAIDSNPSSFPVYYWQWGNHGPRRVPKPNFGPRITPQGSTQLHFSSMDTADACTLAQTATALGLDGQAQKFARDGGVQLTKADPGGSRTDVCVIWDKRLPPNAEGVLLDYEVQDGRTPARTRSFLLEFARLVHGAGKKAILYTNPLDAPTQRFTGIDPSNAHELMNAFDRTSIFLWSRNRQGDIASSFASQLAVLGQPDPKKLMVVFELANTSQHDAAVVKSIASQRGIDAVFFWRNYARQGGACDTDVNRKIACLAFNDCSAR